MIELWFDDGGPVNEANGACTGTFQIITVQIERNYSDGSMGVILALLGLCLYIGTPKKREGQ